MPMPRVCETFHLSANLVKPTRRELKKSFCSNRTVNVNRKLTSTCGPNICDETIERKKCVSGIKSCTWPLLGSLERV